jgi:transcriptional regulator with XRE-family HTH domain
MKNLKKLRDIWGLSQKELADKLNVKQATVSGWENGTREPDSATMIKLAEIFNCTVDYLLGRVDKPDRVLLYDSEGAEIGWAAVIDTARASGLTPEEMQQVIKIMTRKKP